MFLNVSDFSSKLIKSQSFFNLKKERKKEKEKKTCVVSNYYGTVLEIKGQFGPYKGTKVRVHQYHQRFSWSFETKES